MPVDPFGYETGPYYSPDQGIWYGDEGYDSQGNWYDLISQGINAAQQAYQIGEAGYPPYASGSTNIYAPQYPQQPQAPVTLPQLYPTTPTAPAVAPSGGIQLSTTTLMLLVGGVLLFMLGTKKGR
jgi:hypothetical protein